MSAEQELARLKAALRLWASSKTYDEGCRRWSELVRLIGEDVAQESPSARAPESEREAS